MPGPTYRQLAALLAEIAAFLRELGTTALGIPGRLRFRILRKADKAERAAREAENGENGPPK